MVTSREIFHAEFCTRNSSRGSGRDFTPDITGWQEKVKYLQVQTQTTRNLSSPDFCRRRAGVFASAASVEWKVKILQVHTQTTRNLSSPGVCWRRAGVFASAASKKKSEKFTSPNTNHTEHVFARLFPAESWRVRQRRQRGVRK
jgi:hypothetical protein